MTRSPSRWFDELFTAAVAAGVRQAVILAAGLDTRAFRLDWPDGTTVYELDQPEVTDFKTRTLASLDAKPKADQRTIAIDLRNDWPKALLDNGFDATQPTAWIAEGLLVYLPPEAQDLLFDRIDELSASGSRVATEHITDTTMFSEQITERLKKYGHDIDMENLIYHGERSPVSEYLAVRGWDVTSQTMREAYAVNAFAFPENFGYLASASYVSAVKR